MPPAASNWPRSTRTSRGGRDPAAEGHRREVDVSVRRMLPSRRTPGLQSLGRTGQPGEDHGAVGLRRRVAKYLVHGPDIAARGEQSPPALGGELGGTGPAPGRGGYTG